MDRLLLDVRFAARSLRKRPTLTAAVVLTLAFGIGANAAVFGVIDALLMHPYDMHISLQYIASVMAAFAGLALMLAVLGLYAVMSYLIAQRVREIGVRIALGATGRDVKSLTLSQAARLTATGLAVGSLLAVALGRAMEAGLLGLVSSDVRLTALLALALGATALAASYFPARRAAAVDPIVALRSE